MATDRSQYEVSLLPEELSSVAGQLGHSVQVVREECCYPGRERRDAWWAYILIDGQVKGTVITPCPLESYSVACENLYCLLGGDADIATEVDDAIARWKHQERIGPAPDANSYLQNLLDLVGGRR